MNKNSGVSFVTGTFLSTPFSNPTANTDHPMTVAFWIKGDVGANSNPSTIFKIVDAASTQRMKVYFTTDYYVQVRNSIINIAGIVNGQWNSVVLAVHECYYLKGYVQIMVNRVTRSSQKINPSCTADTTTAPYISPYTLTVGSFDGSPFIAGNIKYLTVEFNFDIQIDYYYTCFNSCAISTGAICFQCNDSKVLWLDNWNCENYLTPTIQSCPSDTALSGPCTCISGYRFSNYKFMCEPCSDPNCISCPNSASVCSVCQSYYDLINGQCINYCATGCATCLDRTDRSCTSCMPGYNLYQTFCVSSCPTGFIPDSSRVCQPCTPPCKSCSGIVTNCTSCTTGYLLPGDIVCNATCPQYYYGDDSTTLCSPCDSRCASCFGGSNSQCDACMPSMFVLPSTSCYSSCPNGYYPDNGTLTCMPCHANCSACWDASSSSCFSCSDPKYYSSGGTCLQCDLSCGSCIGAGKTLCTSCLNGGILFNGVCIYLNCETGTYPDSNSYDCQPCPPTCPSCSSFTNCTSCISSTLLSNGKCLECTMTGFSIVDGYCTETCGDGAQYGRLDCDDGNLVNDDGCDSTCKVEPGWRCSGGTPTSPDTCRKVSLITVNVSGNTPGTYPMMYVTFSGPVNVQMQWSQAVKITHVASKVVFANFSSLNTTNITYRIDVSYYKYSSLKELFSISTLNQRAIVDRNGTYVVFGNNKVIIDYSYFPNPALEWKDILFICLRVVLILPLFLAMFHGYKYRAWMSLELLQNTAMIVFLNVDHPKIMYNAMDIIYGTSFYWFPNPFNIYSYDYYENSARTPPPKYQEYQVSSLFIHNSGGLIMIFITVGLINWALRKLKERNPKRVLLGTLYACFDRAQLKRLWLSLYVFMLNGVLVQLTHVNFEQVVEFLSVVLSLIFGVLLLLTFILISPPKARGKKETKYKGKNALSSNANEAANLFSEFKTAEGGVRYVSFQILLKMVYVGMLCTTYANPVKQCGLVLIPRALSLILVSITRPYYRMKDSLYVIVSEGLLLLTCTSLLLDRLSYEATGDFSTFAYVALVFMLMQVSMIAGFSLVQTLTKKPIASDLVNQEISVPTPYQKSNITKPRKLHIIQKGRGGH